MAYDNVGADRACLESSDPRARLAACFYTSRPEPLETWLWRARVPSGAERVFWLHWREGRRCGDWCSSIPISQVATRCLLDESTVTRAYQLLARLGVLRRTDPGRDPRNPFGQATAITEVFVPRELAENLHRVPKRPQTRPEQAIPSVDRPPAPEASTPAQTPSDRSRTSIPYRERRRQMAALEEAMSDQERARYRDATFRKLPTMTFDPDTKVSESAQKDIRALLGALVVLPVVPSQAAPAPGSKTSAASRRLSLFELAWLRRHLQNHCGMTPVSELARQVAWAVEKGALTKLPAAKALNVALKKIREGAWTRPHGMPPNWTCAGAFLETCAAA